MGVRYTADFETGVTAAVGDTPDGNWLVCLNANGTVYSSGSAGGAGSGSTQDVKIVSSASVGGETINPRTGTKFLLGFLDKSKNYAQAKINDPGGSVTYDKPRWGWNLSNTAYHVEFDTEFLVGFSIYTPLNFEHELGVKDNRGGVGVFFINVGASSTLLSLLYYVQSPNTQAHWYLQYYINDASILENANNLVTIDLGPVLPDIGKWTDFVFDIRSNPFSVTTNPSTTIQGAKNATYQGNKGILKLWKSEGAYLSGTNRQMVLKVNEVNTPIGLVPTSQGGLQLSLRQYKYGWKKNPTTVVGPVWNAFDSFKYGEVIANSTVIADVNPSGQAISVASPVEIIRINSDLSITPDSELNFTCNGSSAVGVSKVTLTQGATSHTALAVNSNDSGGKFTTGSLTGFTNGAVTVAMEYDNSIQFDNETASAVTTWGNFNTTVVATDGVYGYTNCAVITNTGAISGLRTSKIADAITVSPGDVVTVRLAVEAGIGNSIRFKIIQGSDELNIGPVLLSATPVYTQTEHGASPTPTVTKTSIGNIHHFVFSYTASASANGTANTQFAIGPGTTTQNDTIKLLGLRAWVNESVVTMSHTTEFFLPGSITKKFVWSNAAGNAIHCYNANTNTLTPFTGNMAVTISDGDWFAPGDDVNELAYAPVVAFVNGEAELVEADLTFGSINALLTGSQGYNYWATNGTCRADNAIELTAE